MQNTKLANSLFPFQILEQQFSRGFAKFVAQTTSMRKLFFVLTVVLLSCASQKAIVGPGNSIDPYHFSSSKKTISSNGAVASAHPLASKVGVEIMKRGGNAFDAAIATQLALAVVYPNAGNLGGGGFMVARTAAGASLALDYREMGPAAAHRDMYLDANGNVMAGKSLNGHLASGVPGTVAGLSETMKYAKFSWKELVQPAIDLAEKGFVLTQREAASLNSIQNDLKKYNTTTSALHKTAWKSGDTLVQTDLANTLKRIRDNGAAGFYEGRTAELMVEEMKRGSGIISLQDLKNYKAKWRSPHSFDYKGYTIVGMPMPSSGGTLLHQMMKMVEPYPISTYGFLSVESVSLMTEIERRAFADRGEYMGDADFTRCRWICLPALPT
jgi:gamma-glutamyltranspeptidase / glutathione hydrolase